MKQNRKQPWNQTFSNVRDSSGHLSRTKLHHQDHNNNVITAILVIIIGLIAVFALIYGLASNTFGHDNSSHRAETRVSRVSHSHKHHKKHTKHVKKVHQDIKQPSVNTNNNSSSIENSRPISDSSSKITSKTNQNNSNTKPKSNNNSKNASNSSNGPSRSAQRQSTPSVNPIKK